MVDASLTISIDRTALSLSALVFSAAPGSELGVTDYVEPARQPRVSYAPASDFVHGDLPLSWAWQQTLLNFSFTTQVSSESESRSLVAAVEAALTQGLEYEVTVTVSGAPAETWVANPGSLVPEGGRSLVDLKHVRPVWAVSIPCFPVRSVA